MRLVTVLILILSFTLAPSTMAAKTMSAKMSYDPDGFRGVRWADKYSKHKSKFTLLENKKNASFYRRINEDMTMGQANLSMIAYRFYKNRFSGVLAFTKKGDANKIALIRALKRKYGPGAKPFKDQDRYLWQGNKTRIYVECKSSRQNCTLLILSMKIARIEKNDR